MNNGVYAMDESQENGGAAYEGQERREAEETSRRELSDTNRRDGWDRRRGPGRRRSDDRRTAEEGEMNEDQFEFIMAVEEYKKANSRPFPSFTEILEIAKALGYRKVADPIPITALCNDDD
jgi:hypothetical protein